MTVTMMVVFGSAFFTDVIGVHAIWFVISCVLLNYTHLTLGLSRGLRCWTHRPSRRRAGNNDHRKTGRYGFHHLPSSGKYLIVLSWSMFNNNTHIFKYFTLSGLSTDLTLLDNGNFSPSITEYLCNDLS